MDPQFQELSEHISTNVSAIVTRDVTAAVVPAVTAAVIPAVTAAVIPVVTDAVIPAVTAAVTLAVNAHVTEVVTAAERRLSEQAQINVEAVKSQAKLAAEGYAATLDGINRRLDDIETSVTVTLRDHHDVLMNHGDRIRTLEQK